MNENGVRKNDSKALVQVHRGLPSMAVESESEQLVGGAERNFAYMQMGMGRRRRGRGGRSAAPRPSPF